MGEEIIDVSLGSKDEEQQKNEHNLEEFLENNKLTIGIFILGIILLGAGVLGFKIFSFSAGQPKVEILGTTEDGKWKINGKLGEGGTEENKTVEKITVEAAGEVVKPGVYELKFGSRVNDLLTMAGGLSVNADRDWAAKNINMAMKLVDGAKIYIPSINQSANIKEPASRNSFGIQSQNLNLKTNNLININTASEGELDTLWGIGPATAKKIIEGRPYQKPEELLQKKIIKSNVWERIKNEITVY